MENKRHALHWAIKFLFFLWRVKDVHTALTRRRWSASTRLPFGETASPVRRSTPAPIFRHRTSGSGGSGPASEGGASKTNTQPASLSATKKLSPNTARLVGWRSSSCVRLFLMLLESGSSCKEDEAGNASYSDAKDTKIGIEVSKALWTESRNTFKNDISADYKKRFLLLCSPCGHVECFFLSNQEIIVIRLLLNVLFESRECS